MTWKPLLNFVIPGRPVPWKPLHVAKGITGAGRGIKNERLAAWQAHIQTYARIAMADARAKPTALPVRIRASFVIPKKPLPDLTNLVKALEDACNKVVWLDDRQVIEHVTRRFHDPKSEGFVHLLVEIDDGETQSQRLG